MRLHFHLEHGIRHGQLPHQSGHLFAEDRGGLATFVVQGLGQFGELFLTVFQQFFSLGDFLVDVLEGVHLFFQIVAQGHQVLEIADAMLHHQAVEEVVALLEALQLFFVKLRVVFAATQVVGDVFQFNFQVFNAFSQVFSVGQKVLESRKGGRQLVHLSQDGTFAIFHQTIGGDEQCLDFL